MPPSCLHHSASLVWIVWRFGGWIGQGLLAVELEVGVAPHLSAPPPPPPATASSIFGTTHVRHPSAPNHLTT